jgi:hypothetical protein
MNESEEKYFTPEPLLEPLTVAPRVQLTPRGRQLLQALESIIQSGKHPKQQVFDALKITTLRYDNTIKIHAVTAQQVADYIPMVAQIKEVASKHILGFFKITQGIEKYIGKDFNLEAGEGAEENLMMYLLHEMRARENAQNLILQICHQTKDNSERIIALVLTASRYFGDMSKAESTAVTTAYAFQAACLAQEAELLIDIGQKGDIVPIESHRTSRVKLAQDAQQSVPLSEPLDEMAELYRNAADIKTEDMLQIVTRMISLEKKSADRPSAIEWNNHQTMLQVHMQKCIGELRLITQWRISEILGDKGHRWRKKLIADFKWFLQKNQPVRAQLAAADILRWEDLLQESEEFRLLQLAEEILGSNPSDAVLLVLARRIISRFSDDSSLVLKILHDTVEGNPNEHVMLAAKAINRLSFNDILLITKEVIEFMETENILPTVEATFYQYAIGKISKESDVFSGQEMDDTETIDLMHALMQRQSVISGTPLQKSVNLASFAFFMLKKDNLEEAKVSIVHASEIELIDDPQDERIAQWKVQLQLLYNDIFDRLD